MSSWWWLWMVFTLLFLVFPIGYGWGYRGWGPPYPRYIQRRRAQELSANGHSPPFVHQSWGWGGDFVWIVFLVGLVWAVVAVAALPFWA